MNCEQFQKEIERAIDERSSSASVSANPTRANLAGHADSCETCRSAWQDFLLLESALTSWTEPAQVDLVDRVVKAALAEFADKPIAEKPTSVPSPPSEGEGGRRPDAGADSPLKKVAARRKPSGPSAPSDAMPGGLRRSATGLGLFKQASSRWLAIATAAVLVIGAAIVFRPGPEQTADNDSAEPAPEHDVPFTPDLNEDQYAGVDELIASTRSAWEGIASKAANRASGLSVFVPDLKSDLGLPVSEEPEEPPKVEVNGQKPSLIPGEINRAFDFLLDVSDVTTT